MQGPTRARAGTDRGPSAVRLQVDLLGQQSWIRGAAAASCEPAGDCVSLECRYFSGSGPLLESAHVVVTAGGRTRTRTASGVHDRFADSTATMISRCASPNHTNNVIDGSP